MTTYATGQDSTRAQVRTSTRAPDGAVRTAPRLASARWLNPRVGLGIALVLGSLVVGARVVAAADRTTAVLVAARDLVPGERITAGDLGVARVHLAATGQRYVAAGLAPRLGYLA